MELISDRSRRVSVDELNTTQLLAHARKQAVQRKLDDMIIVDVDSHHYENECYDEFLPLIENDVLRQLIMAGRTKGRGQVHTGMTRFQDSTPLPRPASRTTAGPPAPASTCLSALPDTGRSYVNRIPVAGFARRPVD